MCYRLLEVWRICLHLLCRAALHVMTFIVWSGILLTDKNHQFLNSQGIIYVAQHSPPRQVTMEDGSLSRVRLVLFWWAAVE